MFSIFKTELKWTWLGDVGEWKKINSFGIFLWPCPWFQSNERMFISDFWLYWELQFLYWYGCQQYSYCPWVQVPSPMFCQRENECHHQSFVNLGQYNNLSKVFSSKRSRRGLFQAVEVIWSFFILFLPFFLPF